MICRLSTFALACFCGLSASAAEFIGEAPSGESGTPTPTDNLRKIPHDAYNSSPALGVPYSSLFRDTNAPYLNTLRDVRLTPSLAPAESVNAGARVDMPDFRGRFPLFQRGFAPENADLKIGPIYFKLRHISTAVLVSDNINHSEDDPKSGSLSIFSIGGQIMAQLTEGFHIAASGNFVYFPFEGRGGFTGFALRAPYSFGITSANTARTQVAWEPTAFGLPFVIADEFKVGLFRYSNTVHDDFNLIDGGNFDAADREGVYTFRARNRGSTNGGNSRDNQTRGDHIYFSNEASISTSGSLPGQNIFRFRASHENIWYNDSGSDGSSLPSVRDRASMKVESVREDLRFKPFLHYEFLHRDNPNRDSSIISAGLVGPITDLITFHGEVGYMLRNGSSGGENSSVLWRLGLSHTPNPYTRHSLIYTRNVSDFNEEVTQGVSYHISKTLGPDLSGSAYFRYHTVEDLDGLASNRKEWRTGLILSYLVSPRTSLHLRTQYTNLNYDDNSDSASAWLTRFDCEHRFAERLRARFIYQYEHRNAGRNSYDENLAYLSLSWLFE